jgi:hypothetical protein
MFTGSLPSNARYTINVNICNCLLIYFKSTDWLSLPSICCSHIITGCHNFKVIFINNKSWDSTVGIATGYGLDDQGVGVRVPVGQKSSFLHVVQTGSEVHQTSYPMGTGSSFPGGKAAGVKLTTHLQVVTRLRKLGITLRFYILSSIISTCNLTNLRSGRPTQSALDLGLWTFVG